MVVVQFMMCVVKRGGRMGEPLSLIPCNGGHGRRVTLSQSHHCQVMYHFIKGLAITTPLLIHRFPAVFSPRFSHLPPTKKKKKAPSLSNEVVGRPTGKKDKGLSTANAPKLKGSGSTTKPTIAL